MRYWMGAPCASLQSPLTARSRCPVDGSHPPFFASLRSPLTALLPCHVAPPQVQALRAIEPHLGLEKLYVLGTNCVDNGPREGLEKFLNAASSDPGTVLHYE